MFIRLLCLMFVFALYICWLLLVALQIVLSSRVSIDHSSFLLSGRVPKVSRVLPHKAKE
jgi:hypothetical protein